MIIEDIKKDFYSKIKGKRVLILVNYEVDAICACKILQALFSSDGILYTVIPIDLMSDLEEAFLERKEDEKHVILINCGGTIDLVEVLKPSSDIVFFVIDSHRPLDVSNFYSSGQVMMIASREDVSIVPEFGDIFEDDNEQEEDEPEDLEERLNKKRAKREWERRRDELVFEYVQNTYYARSSAAIAFDLAWKLSKDTFDLLWYGIVGVSEQLLLNKIDEQMYLLECGDLQQHVSRLLHKGASAPDERVTAVAIEFENQLKLAMYRHWTVESSMTLSVASATCLKLWTFNGVKRLHEMFAEIGIPLNQCKQRFPSMEATYRQEFHKSLVEIGPKYGVDNLEIVSFLLQTGYKGPIAALDAVYGLIGLLVAEKPKQERFLDALEALSRSRRERLEVGMEMSQKLLQFVFRQVHSGLETSSIRNAGPFLYFILQEENSCFSHPYGILLLAEFALKAYAGSRRTRRSLPVIVSSPCGTTESGEALCHVAAIAPLAEESNKTFFGKAFEKSAQESKAKIVARYVDPSVIQILQSERRKFFDAMVVLLT